MRKLLTFLMVILLAVPAGAKTPQLPVTVKVNASFSHHVQGMAVDTVNRCFYLSFTNCFVKTDFDGNLLASIDSINGHMGAMTYDYETGNVYATVEYKGDEIGSAISRSMGESVYEIENSHFCLAVLDVSRLTRRDTPVNEVMVTHELGEVKQDYRNKYGCSGIDGITIAPPIGKKSGRRIYIAYGIYSDTTRTDNDHQILLEYKFNRLFAPSNKYFIFTGNTTYGVQNMAYDSYSGNILLACYGGQKEKYPNFSLFAVPQRQKAGKGILKGLEDDGKHLYLKLADDGIGESGDEIRGWMFSRATTGLCPLGNGFWYVAEAKHYGKRHGCTIQMYEWDGGCPSPFEKVE